MHLHASCAARDGAGVLLIGPPGSGKSDLLLRLLDHGFALVADDQVVLNDGVACAPAALAGMIEVRGLGILWAEYVTSVPVVLVVAMGAGDRLPEPICHLGLPLVHVDPAQASAPARVSAALRCALGQAHLVAGAFA